MIEVETQRLKLRQWHPEDRVPFRALNADPQVMAFFPAVLDSMCSDQMADTCERLIAERGWGLWALELKSSGEFIGMLGLHVPTAALPLRPVSKSAGVWR
ncbi:GNAT family N-acetyltransferase [Methylobacillus gramineus]|uniref:GNAT family N-acetyltransferase n=1 Tax=Methylobacillus gramineus TaxID=755169 RepID=UPI00299F5126|nr:GNAT family N-acetyltransferase [Methylobacillus gramineus]